VWTVDTAAPGVTKPPECQDNRNNKEWMTKENYTICYSQGRVFIRLGDESRNLLFGFIRKGDIEFFLY
jgi:hypothetical protein